MDFKAIIFDMDGLLVDSEPLWYEAEKDMIESCGYTYTEEVREQTIGVRVDEFAEIIYRNYPKVADAPAGIIKEISRRVLSLPRERIPPRPGADEILRYVAERQIPRAIASSSGQTVIEHFVKLLGWDRLIPRRFSAEAVARGKPAPDIYLHAARQIGVEPQDCLALEDSLAGTQAALAAGMTCFSVPDLSHSSPADFADINDKVYSSLHDVLDELKRKRIFA
ncbi:MAG: HAD family phosphatase [Chloroflexota bacterium]|nr:HAD family phosphatase [Chloroflexota bacterium]